MKRDMDLVRRILIEAEKSDYPLSADVFVDSQTSRELVGYHMEIMQEAGLIRASIMHDFSGMYAEATVDYLTWDGQEYLANIKSEKVWNRVKTTVASKLGDAGFDVFKNLASKFATDILLGN